MKWWPIIMLVALTACTQLVETGNKANSAVRKTIYRSADKVQELTAYTPEPTAPQPYQTGYCYKASSDIICYELPQPHLTNKLVGFQGAQAYGDMPPASASNTLTDQQIMANQGTATPFYIKEAPYVKADGEVVTSTKILPVVPSAVQSAPVAPVTAPAAASARNPQSLMPRY